MPLRGFVDRHTSVIAPGCHQTRVLYFVSRSAIRHEALLMFFCVTPGAFAEAAPDAFLERATRQRQAFRAGFVLRTKLRLAFCHKKYTLL